MSTVLQDLIASAIDSKMYSVGILIDLAKAFDTVDHGILIKKLANYGIRGTPLMCFKLPRKEGTASAMQRSSFRTQSD